MIEKTVLAIDPGTEKCGLALVKRVSEKKLELLYRSIAPIEHLKAMIHSAYAVEKFSLILVGSGTGSKRVLHIIRENFASMGILILDEKNTTLFARERYWEHNPRRGWRKLVPSSLQVPPVPIDDFAAFVLAERVLLDT